MANDKKLQIAFIGAGMIANALMRYFHDDRRTEIRGLAELNKTALNNAGAEYGIPHLTTDYKALLKEASKHPDLLATGCSCRHARVQPKYPFTKKMIYSGKIGGYSMVP